jgi:cytochrome c oxidase subunit 1
MFVREERLVRWNIYIGLIALALGTAFGPLQGLQYAGVNLYGPLSPLIKSYYQGLTLHGVLNALVWTTFFIMGFSIFVTVRMLDRPLRSPGLAWAGFWAMVVGVVLAAYAILTNQASVLYTFYLPMQAHPTFYIGATLLVVGTWIISAELFLTYRQWRAANPGARTPLGVFGTMVNLALWDIATIGIAAEMLFLAIPWSLGVVEGTDPLLARTLFWFFGHPLVYFWLLPAYVSWYAMVPKQAGGKLFSDPLARLAFLLLLVFSVPVGFHHQFTDPGISQVWKGLQTFTTYAVAFPSLLTAFNLAASLEIGGRARGGKGLLGWIGKLPWDEPSFAAQALAMIVFAFGGVGGLINASYDLNLVVHNTIWVPGHLHLTVGTAVTLTFMGILYWLLPVLTGKALWNKRLALAQAYLWFIGMSIFSLGLHWAGLVGVPRRVFMPAANYAIPGSGLPLGMGAIGGVVLFVSAVLFFVNVVMTLAASKEPSREEMPVAEALSGPETAPAVFEHWRVWLGATVVLILIGYGPAFIQLLPATRLNAPGFQVWGGPVAAAPAAPPAATPAAEAVPAGDATRGEQIFKQGAADAPPCAACHSLTPGQRMVGPSLAGIATKATQEMAKPAYTGKAKTVEEFLRESIVTPDAYVTEEFSPGVMYSNYGRQLTAEQIADLVAYLMTLK